MKRLSLGRRALPLHGDARDPYACRQRDDLQADVAAGRSLRPLPRACGGPNEMQSVRPPPLNQPMFASSARASWPTALSDPVARWKTVSLRPLLPRQSTTVEVAARSAAPVNERSSIRPDHTMAKRIVCAAGVVRARSSFRGATCAASTARTGRFPGTWSTTQASSSRATLRASRSKTTCGSCRSSCADVADPSLSAGDDRARRGSHSQGGLDRGVHAGPATGDLRRRQSLCSVADGVLSQELSGTGVTATALCPGLTDTAMVRGSHLARVVPAPTIMSPKERRGARLRGEPRRRDDLCPRPRQSRADQRRTALAPRARAFDRRDGDRPRLGPSAFFGDGAAGNGARK